MYLLFRRSVRVAPVLTVLMADCLEMHSDQESLHQGLFLLLALQSCQECKLECKLECSQVLFLSHQVLSSHQLYHRRHRPAPKNMKDLFHHTYLSICRLIRPLCKCKCLRLSPVMVVQVEVFGLRLLLLQMVDHLFHLCLESTTCYQESMEQLCLSPIMEKEAHQAYPQVAMMAGVRNHGHVIRGVGHVVHEAPGQCHAVPNLSSQFQDLPHNSDLLPRSSPCQLLQGQANPGILIWLLQPLLYNHPNKACILCMSLIFLSQVYQSQECPT